MAEIRYIVAQNGIMVAKSDSSAYEEIYTAGSTITSGTSITLPNSGTYSDDDLEVFMNGQRLNPVLDYNYVGSLPNRTQVSFTFDLFNTDKITFRRNLS
jgi:hypothetical protein